MSQIRKKRVLVVEDEPDLSAVFVNLLNVFGIDSEVAENAQKAKQTLVQDKFDFFIIDLTLPDRSGIDLYREIVTLNPEYRGNVIFTSGMNMTDELSDIIEKDGTSFLAKPFSLDVLKKTLDRWL